MIVNDIEDYASDPLTMISELEDVLPEHVGPNIVPTKHCWDDELTDLLDPDPGNNGTLWPVIVVTGVDLPKPEVTQTKEHMPPWQARMHANGTSQTVVYASNRHNETPNGSLELEFKDTDGMRERVYIGADEMQACYLAQVQAISAIEYDRKR